MISLDKFYRSLNPEDRDAFAELCGYGGNYMRLHLIAPSWRRRSPRREGLERIVIACEELKDLGIGEVPTRADLYQYFCEPPGQRPKRRNVKKRAAELPV